MGIKRTITTIFIVPTLKIPKDSLVSNGFINAYIKDSLQDNSYPVDVVYLLFKPTNLDKFREFLISEYERTNDVFDDYDYKGGYIVVVYKINESIKKDISLIKQGKYSKTSKEFQGMFPTTIQIKKASGIKTEVPLQIRIFKKSADLREYWENKIGQNISEDQEVWEAYDEETEILNLKNIENV
jgi:hypothetical protein